MEMNKLQQQDEAPSTTFAFPHLSAIHRACQVQSCQETKENIGLVVVLPRTYPLPVANTFSHCCQLQNLSSCCQVQPCQETKEKIGLVVGKKHTATFASLPGTGSTSSIHLNANQSKSSAIQLQTGVFSNLNQVAKLLPTHCFTPAGQPRGLVAF